MSFRCRFGIHGDVVYDYENFTVYCGRCGEDLGPTDALLLISEKTVEKWEAFDEGEIPEWQLWHFIEFMWDEGYPEGRWRDLYEKETGLKP